MIPAVLPEKDRKYFTIFKTAVYGLVAIYLLNCLSPIRLHTDMLRYFAIKDCIELGCPPDSDAAKDYLPYGYTALLLLLSKLHILHSFTIILINCIYMFTGLYLVKKLFDGLMSTWFFLVLVLLNWTMIKFVTHPLSEMQYLFFSMSGLYLFYRYSQEKKVLQLILSFACAALAFITRSVGIALVAALISGLMWMYRKELIRLIRRNKILVGLLALVMIGVVIFSKQLGLDHYTGVFNKQFKEGVTLLTIFQWHFTEWSEIVFNTSIVKLYPVIHEPMAKELFLATGIAIFALFAWLVFFRKNKIPFIVKAYLLFYSILMFEWPFYDPRFWVPVLPLIAAVVAESVNSAKPFNGIRKPVLRLAFAAYAFLGVAAVGYFTYTSIDKHVMARTHANGVFRNEYETVLFGKPQTDTAKHIDAAALSVIQRYN